jgi:hypothetical protein
MLLSRTVVDNVVVDHGWVTRSGPDRLQHLEVIAIYTVVGRRITHATFRLKPRPIHREAG